jgi:hypothetical protein
VTYLESIVRTKSINTAIALLVFRICIIHIESSLDCEVRRSCRFLGIEIHTEKDDYTMGEAIRCRVICNSDYKKPGHLRVGLVCSENSTILANGKKQIQQHIIYDWGTTLVENKPLARKSYYDVVFQTPSDPEQQLAYPPTFASKGRRARVDLAWGWTVFAVFSKPVRESGEMAWLMENMPERLRDDTGIDEEDKAKLAQTSQSGSGFVYGFSLQKDSSFERASKPIRINYAPLEMSTGESVTAKFTEAGELKAPSRYTKQGGGLDLQLKLWNPTPKAGKVNSFRGVIECWNASPIMGDPVGSTGFILKESGKIDPGESIEMPLRTPGVTGPPTIYGKDTALIWTCRMEVELSWFGKEYAALSFHLLPGATSSHVKKLKLFKFQPIFTDTTATEVPFCETLVKARIERAIPALRTKILDMIPKLWIR